MMNQKISWQQMQQQFPDEWLLITHFELDQFGQVSGGIVERHSKRKDDVANPPIIDRDTAFLYTGESTFAGLRSHAAHNHAI